jgi:hypothetical protein
MFELEAVLAVLKGVGTFLLHHLKECFIAAVAIAIFIGGAYYEGKKKDKEIDQLKQHFAELQNQREKSITQRLDDAENNSKNKADQLTKERDQAIAEARDIKARYDLALAERKKTTASLQAQLENAKKNNASDAEVAHIQEQLDGLEFKLSPDAVTAINGFVAKYGAGK